MKLANQVVLITGGTSGIGLEAAKVFCDEGAKVAFVVTTSLLNEVGVPGLSILSASKAAVRSLVCSLGAELAPRGIRVNAVSPGPIDTPFHTKIGLPEEELRKSGEAIAAAVPLKRFGTAACRSPSR